MTDHKAEAATLLEDARKSHNGESSTAMATAALTHATLYAAEQQRIANVIAYLRDSGLVPTAEVHDQMRKDIGL